MSRSFSAKKGTGTEVVETKAGEEIEQRLQGATLLTAEVLYYMPDHPKLLQTFMWQTMDYAPKYPRLNQFLDFWKREIEAAIHSVRVAHGEPSMHRNGATQAASSGCTSYFVWAWAVCQGGRRPACRSSNSLASWQAYSYQGLSDRLSTYSPSQGVV